MKNCTLLVFLLFFSSFSFGEGIITPFSNLPRTEQEKIVENDFKVLRALVKELESTVASIEENKTEIKKLQKQIDRQDDLCLALFLIEAGLNSMRQQLSKMPEGSTEHKKFNQNILDYQEVYNLEIEKTSCEPQEPMIEDNQLPQEATHY
jgi:N-methylhydantoinase B/oxoprolinase/acetone carboxylase alpha subunit